MVTGQPKIGRVTCQCCETRWNVAFLPFVSREISVSQARYLLVRLQAMVASYHVLRGFCVSISTGPCTLTSPTSSSSLSSRAFSSSSASGRPWPMHKSLFRPLNMTSSCPVNLIRAAWQQGGHRQDMRDERQADTKKLHPTSEIHDLDRLCQWRSNMKCSSAELGSFIFKLLLPFSKTFGTHYSVLIGTNHR